MNNVEMLGLKLAAKLELCRRDFGRFYSFISGWQVPDHIKAIVDKLQSMPDNGRLIVALPPRHSKSTTISHLYPIWLMGNAVMNNEECKVGIYTYGQALSDTNSYKARNFYRSDLYRMVFPGVELETDNIRNWILKTGEKEVSYRASSVGGAATGIGYNYLIIDDPIKDLEEARNRDLTQKLFDWYIGVANTRLEKGGKQVILATRWTEHDLTGRLLETGGYDLISLPAINDRGEALWPQQFPIERLQEIKTQVTNQHPDIWEAEYQQNPIPPEGKLIKKHYIKYGKPEKQWKHKIISWDTASTVNQASDYSVGVEVGMDEAGNYYVIDMIRVREEFPNLINIIKSWGSANDVYIEEKDSGIQTMQVLRQEKVVRRSFIGNKPTISKHSRLEKHSGKFAAGRVFFLNKFPELEKELLQFPDGQHDDCVDALSQALECFPTVEVAMYGDRDTIISRTPYKGIFGG